MERDEESMKDYITYGTLGVILFIGGFVNGCYNRSKYVERDDLDGVCYVDLKTNIEGEQNLVRVCFNDSDFDD
jgi:hypothetical protein